ncbi:MAG TPA: hypothetical protein VK797_00405 [Tepidisphaeraceae bacterium]|jgi:hypothetical protein|nr:hypothetical protein [Tepidisphaeraceae bacterium]
MDETFQIAELIDEIAHKADPVLLVDRLFFGLKGSAVRSTAIVETPRGKMAEIGFKFPIPADLENPEEIVDYLETGLGPLDSLKIVEENGQRFIALTRTIDDPGIAKQVDEAMSRIGKKLKEANW